MALDCQTQLWKRRVCDLQASLHLFEGSFFGASQRVAALGAKALIDDLHRGHSSNLVDETKQGAAAALQARAHWDPRTCNEKSRLPPVCAPNSRSSSRRIAGHTDYSVQVTTMETGQERRTSPDRLELVP